VGDEIKGESGANFPVFLMATEQGVQCKIFRSNQPRGTEQAVIWTVQRLEEMRGVGEMPSYAEDVSKSVMG
jgi:hypothetical protein